MMTVIVLKNKHERLNLSRKKFICRYEDCSSFVRLPFVNKDCPLCEYFEFILTALCFVDHPSHFYLVFLNVHIHKKFRTETFFLID